MPSASSPWSPSQSASLYRLDRWGAPFFAASDSGEVEAILGDGPGASRVSLAHVARELEAAGHELPAIVRFPDILASRISRLVGGFDDAIARHGYRGRYRGCFPVKVNQKREVIDSVSSLSRRFHFGLEAGTKAELAAAMVNVRDPEAYLICNGYKDASFIDLALYGLKLGIRTVIVIERTEEVPVILERAKALKTSPLLGVRIRINGGGCGRWSSTSGDRGLFGLSTLELVRVVDHLRNEGMLDCLRMLHFHQGSQIPDLRAVRYGLEEAASIFVELAAEGAPLSVINIGGGLAIDYEGTANASQSSKNYRLADYCDTVVEVIRDYMDANRLPHPDIVSESGRAIASHYSVLLFRVLGSGQSRDLEAYPPEAAAPRELRMLYEIIENITPELATLCLRQADQIMEQCRVKFAAGEFSLRQLAGASRLRGCLSKMVAAMPVNPAGNPGELGPRVFQNYYGNFSIFQSLPDSWAIGQLFPIMPVHRLDERPGQHAIIADITCDCDGKIKRYVGGADELETLPVHTLLPGQPYYLGAFLTGAYQETLGDIHNLLAAPAVVSVRARDGGAEIDFAHDATTVSGVLGMVDFDEEDLLAALRALADEATDHGRLTEAECRSLIRLYNTTLKNSTYLNLLENGAREASPPASPENQEHTAIDTVITS
ncbi:MAG: biosynthetic arginine decarboxylase [Verrucomicrobiae bacterium]|nr:biosynthetic arginine decarboxylase [Verrucomicrobiae bacterium]